MIIIIFILIIACKVDRFFRDNLTLFFTPLWETLIENAFEKFNIARENLEFRFSLQPSK